MENMETIAEEKNNYRFRIDYGKWSAAVDALLAERASARARTEKKNWSAMDAYYDPKLTKLYSIRAQSRGRIHMRYTKLDWGQWSKLPSSKINKVGYDEFTKRDGAIGWYLTLDDQAAYIGDSWKEYEKTE